MDVATCQVSVVEARDVRGDWLSPPKFYVKLKTTLSQVATDVVSSKDPQFLKDARLEFDAADENGYLEIALLQNGDHGDLVIGSVELKTLDILRNTSTPEWQTLRDPEGTETGELRLVIRNLRGPGNQSATRGALPPTLQGGEELAKHSTSEYGQVEEPTCLPDDVSPLALLAWPKGSLLHQVSFSE